MVVFSGSLSINGIEDRELIKILEVKSRTEGSFIFNPQALQAQGAQGGRPAYYNNVSLGWNTEAGLNAAHEILTFLLKKEADRGAQVG